MTDTKQNAQKLEATELNDEALDDVAAAGREIYISHGNIGGHGDHDADAQMLLRPQAPTAAKKNGLTFDRGNMGCVPI
ncbi:MAG: hypothetical protein AAGC81_04325 [Pseudomonadota bacterium]